MTDICATFGPVDIRNPWCGYQVRVEDVHGRLLLFTNKSPVDGSPLQTPRECLTVINYYVERGCLI